MDAQPECGLMSVHVRPAVEADQPAILALVRSERLNPTKLSWQNFMVATDESGIVGAVQVRDHPDGSHELGSLVVRPEARGRGVASRLMDSITANDSRRLLMVTGAAFASHFVQWGFREIDAREASHAVRRNYRIGRLGSMLAILAWRRPKRLVILDRRGSTAPQRIA